MTMTEHDIWEVMRTARSIRRYEDAPVDDEVLARCLEAATWASSGGNKQLWRFVVMNTPEARSAMSVGAARALGVLEEKYQLTRPDAADDSARGRNARALYELHDRAGAVPGAVLFCAQDQPGTPREVVGASTYFAAQNFLLAARASGLGTCVTGWHVMAQAEFREALGMPDDWHMWVFVTVGWPRGHHGPVRRRPVHEVAYAGRWDDPFGP